MIIAKTTHNELVPSSLQRIYAPSVVDLVVEYLGDNDDILVTVDKVKEVLEEHLPSFTNIFPEYPRWTLHHFAQYFQSEAPQCPMYVAASRGELLGRGASGDVYSLDSTKIGKFTGHPTMEIFKRAGNLWAISPHDHLNRFMGIVFLGDPKPTSGCGLVFERVDGPTVHDWLQTPTPPTFDQKKKVATDMVEVLIHLEAHQIFHDDIKSYNVMRSSSGQTVVIDYDYSAGKKGEATDEQRLSYRRDFGRFLENMDPHSFGAFGKVCQSDSPVSALGWADILVHLQTSKKTAGCCTVL